MKKFFGILAVVLLCSSAAHAEETPVSLDQRFGVGVNWQGAQVAYGFSDQWMGEAKIQFSTNNILTGARLYNWFPEIPRMIFPTLPYVGLEGDWIFSDYLQGGILGGIFVGVELLPSQHFGISFDIGPYYQSLWSAFGSFADLGIVANLGVTYFF